MVSLSVFEEDFVSLFFSTAVMVIILDFSDQDDREISITTWADNSELNPRGIVEYHLSIDTSAIYDSLQK